MAEFQPVVGGGGSVGGVVDEGGGDTIVDPGGVFVGSVGVGVGVGWGLPPGLGGVGVGWLGCPGGWFGCCGVFGLSGRFDGELPSEGASEDVSEVDVSVDDVSDEDGPETGVLRGAFTCEMLVFESCPGWASPPPATAKLASAAHAVATLTPAAASSA
ncbi:hypothetical protein [Kibdelosporangium aridum]|uniref:hypothetical protein n=1 Tax=Kibdelosporangium aridum TaxID=2030 RepID=UPI00055C4AFB|nr:hypothetical protein [Kibdelosporangium aridum]